MTQRTTELIQLGATPLTAEDARRYRREGSWPGKTIRSLLDEAARQHPDRTAVIGLLADGGRRTMTYAEFDAAASRAANALASIGVAPGDAVAVMLPNLVEYPSIVFACHELRAVYVGIPVSYGALQVLPVLRRSRAKVIVIPRGWRSVDHLGLIRSLRAELPDLQQVVVVDDSDAGVGDEILWSSLGGAPDHGVGPADPGEVCYLGFTSGTTGEPKGAMHTHDTLMNSIEGLVSHIGIESFGDPMVQLVATPVGHHTGYVWCTLLTVYLAGTGVQIDRWDPQWAADVIRSEGVTTFFGAPAFLQDMLRTDFATGEANSLRCLVVAGSPVPRSLPSQAAEALGAYVAPAWGMTECSITIACTPSEVDGILRTDGSVFEDSSARIVDADGIDAGVGASGELLVKGPSLFLGYFERPDATSDAFTSDGWFRTGDTAVIDEHGWVSLMGRSKDIVIRGGENIPVTDVETLLFDHPAILNVAVVGVPDDRLGERACAVVVFREGQSTDLAGLSRYLIERGLSKHFVPERLIIQESLPTTQSGKIQKFRLRELVAIADSPPSSQL